MLDLKQKRPLPRLLLTSFGTLRHLKPTKYGSMRRAIDHHLLRNALSWDMLMANELLCNLAGLDGVPPNVFWQEEPVLEVPHYRSASLGGNAFTHLSGFDKFTHC